MGRKMDFLFYLPFLLYIIDDRLLYCNSLSKICLLISQLVMTPMSTYVFNTSLQVIHQLEKKKKKSGYYDKIMLHKYATVDKISRFLNGKGELILKTSKNQGQYLIMPLWQVLCLAAVSIFWLKWQFCQYTIILPSPSKTQTHVKDCSQ